MEIQGNGLLARAFADFGARDEAVIVFAKGVSDSTTTDPVPFERERRELEQAIEDSGATGRILVYLSGGGAVYGQSGSVRHESDELLPITMYGRHQVACEELVVASGIGYLIARIPNAVGHPQRRAQLVPSLVQQVMSGRVAINPAASRDLIGAFDVARLVVGLLRGGARNLTVNVASGISTGLTELVEHIECLLDARAEHVLLPNQADPQEFSIDLLRSYLPEWLPAADYPFGLLDQYVHKLIPARG